MNFLFFDTETSGLPRFRRAPAWFLSNWPRAVQLGWVLTDDRGNELNAGCQTIKPNGFEFAPDAVARHGITPELATQTGRQLSSVLGDFGEDLKQAEVVVAHNIQFDKMILKAEFIRARQRNLFRGRHLRCTMKEATEFCALPRGSKLKWPSLTELHQILFKSDFDQKHDALSDSRACLRCFWELRRQGVL